MDRKDVYTIIALHWLVFAMIIFIGWLMMSTNNLKLELQYMKDYKEGVTSENLQDLMCNGTPIK
jgi:hypothetical protein